MGSISICARIVEEIGAPGLEKQKEKRKDEELEEKASGKQIALVHSTLL